MELMQQLGFAEVPASNNEVPEHHKAIIKERLSTLKKEDLLEWEKVKDDFKTE